MGLFLLFVLAVLAASQSAHEQQHLPPLATSCSGRLPRRQQPPPQVILLHEEDVPLYADNDEDDRLSLFTAPFPPIEQMADALDWFITPNLPALPVPGFPGSPAIPGLACIPCPSEKVTAGREGGGARKRARKPVNGRCPPCERSSAKRVRENKNTQRGRDNWEASCAVLKQWWCDKVDRLARAEAREISTRRKWTEIEHVYTDEKHCRQMIQLEKNRRRENREEVEELEAWMREQARERGLRIKK